MWRTRFASDPLLDRNWELRQAWRCQRERQCRCFDGSPDQDGRRNDPAGLGGRETPAAHAKHAQAGKAEQRQSPGRWLGDRDDGDVVQTGVKQSPPISEKMIVFDVPSGIREMYEIGELLPRRIEIGRSRRRRLRQEKRVRGSVGDRYSDRNRPAVTAVVSYPEGYLLLDERQNRKRLAYRDGPNAAVAQDCNAAITQLTAKFPLCGPTPIGLRGLGSYPFAYQSIGLSLTVQPERAVSPGVIVRTLPSPNAPSSKPPLVMRFA